MKFSCRFLKILLVSFGGFMAGCIADNSTTLDGKAVLEAQQAEAGIVVSLVATKSQVLPDESVELIFSIQNHTGENFRVLPWGTPLEAVLSADVFEVIYAGELLPYRGRVVKRASPGEADYLNITAGELNEVTVNLSQAYDTQAAGSYEVQLKTIGGEYHMHEHSVRVLTEPLMIERL